MVSEGSSTGTLLGKRALVSKTRSAKDKAALEALCLKAERAQPKSTARNPLYLNFGKPKKTSKPDEGPSKRPPPPFLIFTASELLRRLPPALGGGLEA